MLKYKILIKTKDFVDEFAKKEISQYFNGKINSISKGFYFIYFEKGNENEMFDFVYNIFYFSRVIENIYLEIVNFRNEEFVSLKKETFDFISSDLKFEVDALKNYKFEHQKAEKIFGKFILDSCEKLRVDLENYDVSFKLFTKDLISYLVIDLIGFSLTKRDYKINFGSTTINSIIPNYCFYLLNLDEKKTKYSMIDPISGFGDILIEASLFKPKQANHFKKRFELLIRKLFNYSIKTVSVEKSKNTFYSVVQNNKIFKFQRENIAFSSQSIKLSQYDIDWLDVKFKEEQIDYVVTCLPEIHEVKEREKFLKEFFYQIEFIIKKKFCVISKKEIDLKYFKKSYFKILVNEKIFIGDQKYMIYVFK